jgi:hypothetical protein
MHRVAGVLSEVRMRTLHIAPGHSAGGSLHQAIRGAGRHEEVLFFHDDLSCGS